MLPFKYPYTNFHEINLDWILETVKSNTDRIAKNELKIKLIGGDDPLNSLHPVGSIFISAENTSPASIFGGTWESIGGRFLLGANSTYTAGSTGGEATHTLTQNEMPTHKHKGVTLAGNKLTCWSDSGSGGVFDMSSLFNGSGNNNNDFFAETAGGDAAHNNMPPYLAVYMWKRVADETI